MNLRIVKISYCIIILITYLGCQSIDLPKEKYNQFDLSKVKVFIRNDTLFCLLNNSLECPLRFYISTSDSNINNSLHSLYPVTIRSKKDTIIVIRIQATTLINW